MAATMSYQPFPSINISASSSQTEILPTDSCRASSTPGTTSRPSPGTRQRSSSLLHKNVLTRMRPLPFQYVFSFYHTKPTSSSTPTLLVDTVPDIATFYKIYNNFPFDSLALKDGVHFFRTGVQPLWEDEQNLKGGCWTLKVRKEDGRSVRTWEELCLMVLGGELQAAVASERDHILGISYSPRLYLAHISIWTKCGDNRRSIETLQKTVVSRLSPELRPSTEMDYYYKRHADHDGWEEAVKAARKYGQEEII